MHKADGGKGIGALAKQYTILGIVDDARREQNQMLLQVAAGMRRRATTAEVNIT